MNDTERRKWQLYLMQRVEIDYVTGCWNWQLFKRKDGYGNCSISHKNRPPDQLAHRLAYIVFIGPIPDGLQARHQCHNNGCCNPGHILLGTHLDNKADDRRDGRPHGTAKLVEEQVREIKRLLALRIYTQAQIGTMFGVRRQTITNISTGKKWKYLMPVKQGEEE
jgi:hypothetical protein